MIKASAKDPKTGKNVMILGLSEMNIEKLKNGYPIRFDSDNFGVPGKVFIFYGKTEQSMFDDLKNAGMVSSDETNIIKED